MTYKKLLLTGGTMAALDFVFLKFLTPLFNKMVKRIQGSDIKPNMISLCLTYIVLICQLYYFIIAKNASIMDAFLLGFTSYAIFDLTNYTIFKNYDMKVVIIDSLWGGTLYALTTYIVSKI